MTARIDDLGEYGRRFLNLLPEDDRGQVLAIVSQKELGFREIADQIVARWPNEAQEVWGMWVDYRKGVGMDLYETFYPGRPTHEGAPSPQRRNLLRLS